MRMVGIRFGLLKTSKYPSPEKDTEFLVVVAGARFIRT